MIQAASWQPETSSTDIIFTTILSKHFSPRFKKIHTFYMLPLKPVIYLFLCMTIAVQSAEQLETQTIRIYNNQREIISLSSDIVSADISSKSCVFSSRQFLLRLERSKKIVGHSIESEKFVLSNLRSLNDDAIDSVVVLDDYIFVVHDYNKVAIVRESKDGVYEISAQYELEQRGSPLQYAFRFNNQVLILASNNQLLRCTKNDYKVQTLEHDAINGLQLSKNRFVAVGTDSIAVYELSQMSEVRLIKKITYQILRQKFPNLEPLMLARCEVLGTNLLCLDRANGLYRISTNDDNLPLQSLQKRLGCFDFFVQKEKEINITLECYHNNELYLMNENGNILKRLSNVVRVLRLPEHENLALRYSLHGVAVVNNKYEHENQSFVYEQRLIKAEIIEYPNKNPLLGNESKILLVFAHKIELYSLQIFGSKITCFSKTPADQTISVDLTKEDGSKVNMPVRFIVVPEAGAVGTHWIYIGVTVLLLTVAAFATAIYYYARLEKRWKGIYERFQRSKATKQGQYNIPASI